MLKVRDDEIRRLVDSGEFDAEYYQTAYPDVILSGIEPAEHYLWIGAKLGRNPSSRFSTSYYLQQNPDVADAGLNPLLHYISSGREEGRRPLPEFSPEEAGQTTSRTAQYRIDRTHSITTDDDWLIFVAYSPDGRLSDCQRHQLASFSRGNYRIALIVNSDSFANLVDPGAADCDIQIIRENIGFDFGAWRHAVELIGGLHRARSVSFTNDSIFPVRDADLAALRRRVLAAAGPVVFLTSNAEVRSHRQSFFFCFQRKAIANGALKTIVGVPYYTDKDALIQNVELHFGEWLEKDGHRVSTLFPMHGVEENPTIHYWEDLLESGFPFIKIQLVSAAFLPSDDPRLTARLCPQTSKWLAEHCAGRATGSVGVVPNRNAPHLPAIKDAGRFNSYGAQQAFNLPAAQNETIFVPFEGIDGIQTAIPRIVAVIHGYYPDIVADILKDLKDLHILMRLVITTDQEEKVATIEAQLEEHGMVGDVICCPNRGRDVAPFLIEGGRVIGDAEVILHLHTKKSPHDDVYAGWGDFLRRNLIGSREIALSILKILEENKVGLVYSDHFPEVIGLRNWGFDFKNARALLKRLDIHVDADAPLEFPTSTMFWARREVLDPLFRAGLRYEDFDEEEGQVDGTLAHAIERSFLYIAEAADFSWTKVTALDTPSEEGAPLLRLAAGDLSYAFGRPKTFLSGGSTVNSEFHRAVPEVYPVSVGKSRVKRRRLNALLPTMQPEKIYGGITTALKIIGQIISEFPDDVDVRILITTDRVNAASVAELSERLGRNFTWAMPDDDVSGFTIVGIAENQHIPISVRANEIYLATAWWTADLGYRLLDRQRELHGQDSRLAYIIQDYEPGFYNWSNTYALAEATYHRNEETLALINSEELANYVLANYQFSQAYCIPFVIHPILLDKLKSTVPDKLVLVYGRPGVSRNCFELLVEGLRLWQSRNPTRCNSIEIIFAGEDFDSSLLSALQNARNVGKMSLDDYASTLNRAAVGVSLMVSPHPSYPPLEMASAGCITITNRYQGKDLSLRAPNIISMTSLTPHSVADRLEEAFSRVDYKRKKELETIKPLPSLAPPADFRRIAGWMLDGV